MALVDRDCVTMRKTLKQPCRNCDNCHPVFTCRTRKGKRGPTIRPANPGPKDHPARPPARERGAPRAIWAQYGFSGSAAL
jgi:hypothetical protein